MVDPNAPRKSRYSGRERSISGSHGSSSVVDDVNIKFIMKSNFFKLN